MYLGESENLVEPARMCNQSDRCFSFPIYFSLYVVLVLDYFTVSVFVFWFYVGNKRREKYLFTCLNRASINR